jgi:hypothetical protein
LLLPPSIGRLAALFLLAALLLLAAPSLLLAAVFRLTAVAFFAAAALLATIRFLFAWLLAAAAHKEFQHLLLLEEVKCDNNILRGLDLHEIALTVDIGKAQAFS